jgi:hypothetical protein
VIQREAFLPEQSPGLPRLEQALRRQVDVDPTREQVLEIPGALPVPQ